MYTVFKLFSVAFDSTKKMYSRPGDLLVILSVIFDVLGFQTLIWEQIDA